MASCDQLEWAWVDSCYIDKTSSAELSGAINSMFRWYRDTKVCYAYLSDVSVPWDRTLRVMMMQDFRSSKWFTRGWTLQELLAPDELKFFDKDVCIARVLCLQVYFHAKWKRFEIQETAL